MNRVLKKGVISLTMLISAYATAAGENLSVPVTTQQHSEWCWAASSAAVLNFYGEAVTQCNLVDWAFGLTNACGNTNFNWSSGANQPNSLFGDSGSVQAILGNWGVPSLAVSNFLSWAHIQSDIQQNKPFVIRYGWTSGGGHILVGSGYDVEPDGTRYLYIVDPWPGEGMTTASYAYAKSASDHQWTHSLRTENGG